MLEPEQVAEGILGGVDAETFLILPHPEVLEYFRRKGADYDRWLAACAACRGGGGPMSERTALLADFGGVLTTNVHDAFRAFS